MTTETFSQKLSRLAAEKRAAWEVREQYFETTLKVVYARMRVEDKAAGRDTSGKSVSTRRMLAYHEVMRDPAYRALCDEQDRTERAYREAAGGGRTV